MSAGSLGQQPWAQQLARASGSPPAGGPPAGTVSVTAPITGNGAPATPLALSPATTTTPGSMSAADKVRLNNLQANWDPTLVRYFLLDYDGGNDINVGFVDAAAGATLVPTGLACKTWEHLKTIVAQVGNGLKTKILIKNRAAGATYLKLDGVTADDFNLSSLVGYRTLMAWGSTDLTNSVADRIAAGAIQKQAGPGGGGVWTCAAGATTTVFSVSAGALSAEPALNGCRVRFTGNVTAGLANVTAFINANTASAITVSTPITAPATGDTFVIEQPGVRFGTVLTGNNAVTLVGLAAANDTAGAMSLVGPGTITTSFLETTGATAGTAQFQAFNTINLSSTRAVADETGVSRSLGAGMRVDGGYSVSDIAFATVNAFAHVKPGGTQGWNRIVRGIIFGEGSYLGNGVAYGFTDCGTAGNNPSAPALRIGTGSGAGIKTRVLGGAFGGLFLINPNLCVAGIDFSGCTGACVNVSTSNPVNFCVDNCIGSTGNTDFGIRLTNLGNGCTVVLGTIAPNTVTGTLGDINLVGNANTTHAAFTLTNVVDSHGNQIVGLAGAIVGQCRIVGNQAGSALAVGEVVRGNGANTQVVRAAGNSATIGDSSMVGVMVTPPANNGVGYMAGPGYAYCLFDGAPAIGAIAYLSPTTAGLLTTTVPAIAANNNRLRCGRTVTTAASTALTMIAPELLAIVATGLA